MACTCGNNFSTATTRCGSENRSAVRGIDSSPGFSSQVDSSFVHLSPSLLAHADGTAAKPTPETFLESRAHLLELGQVATGDDPGTVLCLACAERIRKALEADTDRLEQECQMYRAAIEDDRRYQERTIKALLGFWRDGDSTEDSLTPGKLLGAYQSEIEVMKASCKSDEEEIEELVRLRKEQIQLSQDLDDMELNLEEHRNALELEARGFDNTEEQARKQLAATLSELDQLSSIQVRLPAVILDLKVDKERGLRYPLINGLRLAYRPKGDVNRAEIQASWSLAAQLLLSCGALLQYQSKYWKIVPLSSGAKLIHNNNGTSNEKDFTVYNLGHPKCNMPQTLLAWNSLMHGLVQHTSGVLAEGFASGLLDPATSPNLPFDMPSPTSIGGINLLQLDANDDASWSRAIHCMSSNLLWLSECASRATLAEVLLLSQA